MMKQMNQELAVMLAKQLMHTVKLATASTVLGETVYWDDMANDMASRVTKELVRTCKVEDCNMDPKTPAESAKWSRALNKLEALSGLHLFLEELTSQLNKELEKRI